MNADIDKAIKPGGKLCKTLKSFPDDPTPDDVHSLRTQTRRVEAAVHALFADDDRQARKLLKTMKPLRKSAGKVRDMDVLIGKAFALRIEPEQECMIKLVEHLAGMRRKDVQKLGDTVAQRGPKVRKLLKRYTRRLKDGSTAADRQPDPVQGMAEELEHWPKLHQQNLHEFRKQAKELRYMLQLKTEEDREGIDAFGRVKDTAGDWHDWLELENVAREVLNPQTDGSALKAIRDMKRESLRVALTAANAVRRRGPTRLAA